MSSSFHKLLRCAYATLKNNNNITLRCHGKRCKQFKIYRNYCSKSSSDSSNTNGNDDKNEAVIENSDRRKVITTQPGFLEALYYGVEQFGKLKLDLPFSVNIKSLNPQEFPEMNRVFVKLLLDVDQSSIGLDNDSPQTLASLSRLYQLNIEKQENEVSIDAKFKTHVEFPVLCEIEIPMKFDLDINCRGNRTSVSDLESDSIRINTTSDRCELSNIKSGMVDVHSDGGDILCKKVIQGNLNMKVTGNGQIQTERLQGLDISCSTEGGNITSTSTYANKSAFSSKTGNIKLANCHGNSDIRIQNGNLVIDSLDGSMDAQVECGNADVYVTKAKNISIKSSDGSITLKVPDTLQSKFELVGESVTVDQKLPFKTDTKVEIDGQTSIHGQMNCVDDSVNGSVIATTMKGGVSLEGQDWLSSLKLRLSA